MKRHPILAAACLGTAVLATSVVAQEMDADGDGMYSMDEMMAAFPALTEETFTTADTNGDGMIDAEELAGAQADGLVPMQEG